MSQVTDKINDISFPDLLDRGCHAGAVFVLCSMKLGFLQGTPGQNSLKTLEQLLTVTHHIDYTQDLLLDMMIKDYVLKTCHKM